MTPPSPGDMTGQRLTCHLLLLRYSKDTFKTDVVDKSGKLVFVDFYADWCGMLLALSSPHFRNTQLTSFIRIE